MAAWVTGPCIRTIRDSNKMVAGRPAALRIPTPEQKASLPLIPASFYLADPLPIATESRVAAQMPTEPDRYGEWEPGGRQQGVVGSGVKWMGHAPSNRGSCSIAPAVAWLLLGRNACSVWPAIMIFQK